MSAALGRFRHPLELGVFVQVPALAFLWLVWFAYGHGGGGDFAIFRHAGQAVLHGHSPYGPPTLRLLAGNDSFVYPTPFAIPFIPFAAMPARVAAVSFLLLSVSAVLASVRLLGVRDWRCYGAAMLGLPLFGALGVGSIGPFLLLLCALGWHFRNRSVAGLPLAVAAAAKLFLWPLLVWLLVTRRFRAFGAAVATLASILVLWASIDPSGMRHYADTVRLLNDAQGWRSYSIQSLFISLHLSPGASEILAGAVAVAAVAGLVLLRRRSDEITFGAAVVVALVATPILWNHYLILLLVPIALTRPRLAPLWLLPVVLWVTPHPESVGVVWRIAFVLAVVGTVGVASVEGRSLTERLAGLAPSGADALSPRS